MPGTDTPVSARHTAIASTQKVSHDAEKTDVQSTVLGAQDGS